ncbi:hypothetical protein GCM10009675_03390 [Prauserella alba]|uniref:Uncharacterized protein n=1 Tax=Prauserella alba TaxID=176898 RepID=A0ABP4FR82_9PSEU
MSRVDQQVEQPHLVAALGQDIGDVRSDESGATGDENTHADTVGATARPRADVDTDVTEPSELCGRGATGRALRPTRGITVPS